MLLQPLRRLLSGSSGFPGVSIYILPIARWQPGVYFGLRGERVLLGFMDPHSVLSWDLATFFTSAIVRVFSSYDSFASLSSPAPSGVWFLGIGSVFLFRTTFALTFLVVCRLLRWSRRGVHE